MAITEKNNAKLTPLVLLYLKQDNNGNGFTEEERSMILSMLPYLRDWYVQAGASGMIATDTRNNGAFLLGGTKADHLTGGTSADLLVVDAANDNAIHIGRIAA